MARPPEARRYRLAYHPAVAHKDLPRIPANLRQGIGRAIEGRLATAPHRYGAPLRGTLRGYWKLRVGDYRVVFRLTASAVLILAIRHRRDVDDAATRRS